MNTHPLIRRHVLDPVRTRSLWPLLGTFALIFGIGGYLLGSSPSTSMADLTAAAMKMIAPLAALAFSYEAIAGPRESGSLRVLLSHPYTRRQIVLSALIGRIAIVGLAVVTGVAAAALTTLLVGGSIDGLAFVVVAVCSVLLSAVIVGVGIGLSASVSTTNRAAMLAFGLYLLFFAFWGQIPTVIRYVLNGFTFPTGQSPDWVALWSQLNPFAAFGAVVEGVLTEPLSGAFYQTVWFGLLVFVGWFVLSIGIGLWQFDRVDL